MAKKKLAFPDPMCTHILHIIGESINVAKIVQPVTKLCRRSVGGIYFENSLNLNLDKILFKIYIFNN